MVVLTDSTQFGYVLTKHFLVPGLRSRTYVATIATQIGYVATIATQNGYVATLCDRNICSTHPCPV